MFSTVRRLSSSTVILPSELTVPTWTIRCRTSACKAITQHQFFFGCLKTKLPALRIITMAVPPLFHSSVPSHFCISSTWLTGIFRHVAMNCSNRVVDFCVVYFVRNNRGASGAAVTDEIAIRYRIASLRNLMVICSEGISASMSRRRNPNAGSGQQRSLSRL